MTHKVPFIKPKFPSTEEISEDVSKINQNNYFSNNGPLYYEFKDKIETYLGQDIHAVIVSNATSGLQLAIEAVFGKYKGEKKYIAVPSFTFSAGPLAIEWGGFTPIFFDTNALTGQPDIDSFRQAIATYGTDIGGLLLTNNFGIGNAQINEWDSMLKELEIPYIIDSAPGFGSVYQNGDLLGGMGVCEVFSFHITKPFGIGEGGLVTTRDKELASYLESLKNFGFNKDKQTDKLGMNAKISELDCAIGLRILADYQQRLSDRRHTYGRYVKLLEGCPVKTLPGAETSAIQFATIVVDSTIRSRILDNLTTAGIEARTYYSPAVHSSPYFKSHPTVELTQTDDLCRRVISLPVHPDMEPSTVEMICRLVADTYEK